MNAEATAVRTAKSIGAAIPGRWSAPPSDAAVRTVVSLGLAPLRLLFQTRVGRRLTATAVLSILMVGMVSMLYAHADAPSSPGLLATPAAASKPAEPGRAAAATTGAGASGKTTLAAVAAARPAKDAATAATAWYAAQLHLPTDRVQALQQQRVDKRKVKVMVMAQVSATDLPTAFVTVEQTGRGWKVP
jgi:hypothetical protein